jgi:hypothetical protein
MDSPFLSIPPAVGVDSTKDRLLSLAGAGVLWLVALALAPTPLWPYPAALGLLVFLRALAPQRIRRKFPPRRRRPAERRCEVAFSNEPGALIVRVDPNGLPNERLASAIANAFSVPLARSIYVVDRLNHGVPFVIAQNASRADAEELRHRLSRWSIDAVIDQ